MFSQYGNDDSEDEIDNNNISYQNKSSVNREQIHNNKNEISNVNSSNNKKRTNESIRSISSFQKLDVIGEGTYGIVYKAKDKENDSIVALKKLKMERESEGMPQTSLREIELLKEIDHINVVKLLDVIKGSSINSIYLVFEYIENDIASLVDSIRTPFKESVVKCFLLQLLNAIECLHSKWIVHRDLKCSNLLYGESGFLKLADFGLARKYCIPAKPMTPTVATLWYRAPEILLGDTSYSSPIDIWAVGCIFGELLLSRPLINGVNEIDQLRKIYQMLGSPNDNIWPKYSSLPHSKKFDIPHQPYNNLKTKLPNLSTNGLDLLNRLLTYDPNQRITAVQALKHPYFLESPFPQSIDKMPKYPVISYEVKNKSKKTVNDKNNNIKNYTTSKSTTTTTTTSTTTSSNNNLKRQRISEDNDENLIKKYNTNGNTGYRRFDIN